MPPIYTYKKTDFTSPSCRVYRKDIRSFTTIDRGSGEISPAYGSGFRVGRILALLIETGVLYIVFMVSFYIGPLHRQHNLIYPVIFCYVLIRTV